MDAYVLKPFWVSDTRALCPLGNFRLNYEYEGQDGY
jgi:hypothetical protein